MVVQCMQKTNGGKRSCEWQSEKISMLAKASVGLHLVNEAKFGNFERSYLGLMSLDFQIWANVFFFFQTKKESAGNYPWSHAASANMAQNVSAGRSGFVLTF